MLESLTPQPFLFFIPCPVADFATIQADFPKAEIFTGLPLSVFDVKNFRCLD
jgi:hypothetical protein